ncbi:MAG: hypothetical protein QMC37_10555, partial [Flavobacteriales bacterium]
MTNILILLGWLIWVLFKKKQGRYKYALTKKEKKFIIKRVKLDLFSEGAQVEVDLVEVLVLVF